MSGRTFDSSSLDLGAESVEPIRFAFLDFVGEPKFLHSGVGIIPWGGEDWEGIGSHAGIEPISEVLGMAPTRVRLTLAASMREYLAEAMNENTWGCLGELYLGTWEGTALKGTPQLEMRGKMGPPEVQMGPGGERISIIIEDIRGALNRVNGLRASAGDHQLSAIGDSFYSLLPKMLDHKFVFNGQPLGGTPIIPNNQGYDNWGPPP